MAFSPLAYQGLWYELGKYPVFYETFIPSCSYSTAQYIYNRPNDSLNLINICYSAEDVPQSSILGVAKATSVPGRFLIKFVPESFAPFPVNPQAAQYNVLWTDYVNYSFVGDDSATSFYILSRKKGIDNKDMPFIVSKIKELGYDPKQVLFNFKSSD